MQHKLKQSGIKTNKMDYKEFSKWVGNTIEPSEGFYFRHDSVLNVSKNTKKHTRMNKTIKIGQEQASKTLTSKAPIQQFMDKVRTQWKTLKKAFGDLNSEKDGNIEKNELQYYLDHWGYNLSNEEFSTLFDAIDKDGDGKISYVDF